MCSFYQLAVSGLIIFAACLSLRTGPHLADPNPAFQQGKPLEAFIQPTSSGKLVSGLFGCVRNNGHKFHEGIDLYPIARDSSGEAIDKICLRSTRTGCPCEQSRRA